MTPGLPLALTPGHPLGLTPGHPLGLTPGLPFGLTPGLSFGSHPCNSLCLGREPKARVATSRPPPDLVHNEPEFKVEVVLKSRQLRGREREYLVKWKGYHAIEASW